MRTFLISGLVAVSMKGLLLLRHAISHVRGKPGDLLGAWSVIDASRASLLADDRRRAEAKAQAPHAPADVINMRPRAEKPS